MRKLVLLLALVPLMLPPSGEAAAREARRGAETARTAKPAKPELRLVSRASAAPARTARPGRAAARPLPGTRAEGAACTRRGGRLVCARADSIAGWFRDLSPADHAQQDCPAGTFAIHARGHEHVVRCMPI